MHLLTESSTALDSCGANVRRAEAKAPYAEIVFGHNNLQAKPSQIYVINPDGTGLTRITHTNDDSSQPDWGSG